MTKKLITIVSITIVLVLMTININIESANKASSFKFVVWGDTKTGTGILQSESKSIIDKNLNPAFTLYTGDLCGSGPTPSCFKLWKNALNGDSTGEVNNGLFEKTFAVRGNHDSSGDSYWKSVFDFRNLSSRIGAKNYVEQKLDETYSFDYGNSHFVGIDLPGGGVHTMKSSQIAWLDQDLTKAENRGLKHAFLFWHGPIYPVDGHSLSIPPSSLITVLNKHPIISAGFFGHEHVITYTHLSNNTVQNLNCQFEEFISGGAGANLHSLKSGRQVDYYLDKSQNKITYGYILVDVNVNNNNYDVLFYKTDGTLKKRLSFIESGICDAYIPNPVTPMFETFYYYWFGGNQTVSPSSDTKRSYKDFHNPKPLNI